MLSFTRVWRGSQTFYKKTVVKRRLLTKYSSDLDSTRKMMQKTVFICAKLLFLAELQAFLYFEGITW